jgi:ABC-type Mn2+/Zn2+ transport system permease subunit
MIDLGAPRLSGLSSDLAVLLIFAAIVSLGIKLVGTLLMGALTIIPASVARNLTVSAKRYIIMSTIIGGAMSTLGTIIAYRFGWIPGPTIVPLGSALFILSLASPRLLRRFPPKSSRSRGIAASASSTQR